MYISAEDVRKKKNFAMENYLLDISMNIISLSQNFIN